MKKLIIIAVLFCLSAMTFKTEAEEIKDKDFQKFFTDFQYNLKENKGEIDIEYYIDYSAIKKQSKSVKDFVDNHFRAFFRFTRALQEDYGIIIKLSSLNKYEIKFEGMDENGNYLTLPNNYELWYPYSWSIKKKGKNQYSLLFYDNGADNDMRWGVGCTFAKTGDGWSIIDFYWK